MWLVVESGGDEGRAVQASGERWVIGRDPGCNLVVNDEKASRQHAMLRVYADGRAELHDMGSANGVLVNGHKLTGPVLLQGNEMVQIGETLIRTSMQPPSAKATQIGVIPQDLDGPSASTIERRKLRRNTRMATIVGAIAIVAVAGFGTLLATGVIGGGSDTPQQRPISEIVDSLRPSTVRILALTGDSGAGGTGWVLDAQQGLVVTNQHVVNEGEQFQVVVDGQNREAKLMGSAPCDDMAVLKVTDTTGLVTLPLGSQADIKEGDTVVAVGFPGSDSETAKLTATTGVVSVVSTSYDERNAVDVPNYPNVIQTDVAINPGNSGGPLVDTDSQLVGINSAGTTQRNGRIIQGQNYAIGVDRVKEVVPQLQAGRSLYWTGIGLDYVPDPSQLSGAPTSAPGIIVDNIVPGSPAALANFPKPAYITQVNGQDMDGTLQSYCQAVKAGPQDAATYTLFTTTSGSPIQVRIPYATTAPQ
ncbi:MAG: trypsin-like peptidase domain-containing protein [Thermoleophilia bacterium]